MLTPLLTDTRHDVQSPLGFSYPRPSLFICFGLWYPHRKVEKVVIHLFTFKEDWASHAFNEEWFENYLSWFVDTKLAAAELIGQLLLQGAQFLPFAPQIQPLTPPGLGKRSAESNLEEILERSAAMDCGKLLVCALASDETNLSRDEMTILNLFSSDLPAHSGSVRCVMSVVSISIMIIISFLVFTDVAFTRVYSKIEFSLIKMYIHFSIPRSEYQTAAHIGGLSISQEVCGELYSRCELEITELRDLVRGRQWSSQWQCAIVKSINKTFVSILSKLRAYLRFKYSMKDFAVQRNSVSRSLIRI